jgi:hypothetical protein
MGNQSDERKIRSKSEKRAIERGKEVEQNEFFRGNGSQNNRVPNNKSNN